VNELENRIYSARMELRGRSDSPANLVILNLEGEDFLALKRRFAMPGAGDRLEGLRDLFYWDPEVFRESLQKILSQDPLAILVTWHIPAEVGQSLQDPTLETAARNRKVLWSSQFDAEGKHVRPAPNLASRGAFGFNNLLIDSDGVVRRGQLEREDKPSLTTLAEALAAADEKRPPRKSSAVPYLINYAGKPGAIPTCSWRAYLSGEAPPPCANLRGKIVLLARDSAGQKFQTPMGAMSRAEALANEIHTVVNRKPIYRASLLEQSLLILAMIFGGAFYIIYYPVMVSAIAVTGTGLAVVIVLFQAIFHLFDVYIPSTHVAGSLLVTYLVFTGYRLAFQENLQWRSLKQSQYLRELDQMKTNFLSLVSHDLKTPLAKIQAGVDRLKSEGQTPKELVDSIENSNNELKHYITGILNLSKIESQKVILNKKSNDINQIIKKAALRLRPLAQSKQITIEEQLEPLFSVECDEDLMRQVLTNLFDNAIKYSPQGAKVIVRSHEEDGFIRVDVEDFGPGIPKDQLPLMFRKFSRFLRPIQEQVKGTGLGLYLSKYFIELHGGTIRLKSVEGKGTTFTFTLPLNGNEGETILG
jgi:signal transduction histidine kinase